MRRSARVAAAVESATSALGPLPLSLAHRIFLSLPVDSRARAACVSRAWRAALADPALWARLDLSSASGIAEERVTEQVLRGAAAKALGRLSEIDLSGESGRQISAQVLLEVAAHNAHSLRSLHVSVLRYGGCSAEPGAGRNEVGAPSRTRRAGLTCCSVRVNSSAVQGRHKR